MARGDIRQRWSLDGAEEVRRQLALIGAAGEKALRELERATVASSVSLGRFSGLTASLSTAFGATGQALAPVRAAFADLGARTAVFGTAVGGMIPQLNGMKAALLALAGTGGALAAFKAAKDSAFAIDDLADTAQNLGITTDQLQALRLMAAEEGSEVDRLSLALGKFNIATANAALASTSFKVETKGLPSVFRGMADESSHAAGGIGGLNNQLLTGVRVMRGSVAPLEASADAFKILGINAVEFNKLDLFDRLKLIEGPMNRLGSAALQNKVASELFGRAWKDMLPLLANGGKAFTDALAGVKELGIGLSDADKKASNAFLISFARLEASFTAAKTRLGSALGDALLPVFDELTRVLSTNMDGIRRWAKEMGTAAVPVVRDLVTLIGNLGRTMEEQQPLHTSFGQGLLSTFGALKGVVLGVAGAFRALIAAVDIVLIPINKLFGTELTGGVVLATALVLKFVGAFALLGGIVQLMIGLRIAIVALLAVPLWTVAVIAGVTAAIVGLTALTTYLLIHTDAWKNFKSIVESTGGILGSVATIALRAARGDFSAIKQIFADIGSGKFGVGGAVGNAVAPAVAVLRGSVGETKNAVTVLRGSVGETKNAVTVLRGSVGEATGALGTLEATMRAATAAKALTPTATPRAPVSTGISAGGLTGMVPGLQRALDMSNALHAGIDEIPGAFQTAWDTVGAAMTERMEATKAAWTAFKDWMAAQNQAFWDALGAVSTAVDQNIRSVWGDLSGWVTETLGGALSGIWDGFKSAADSAFSNVSGLLQRLVDAARSAASAISSAFSSVPSPAAYAPIPPYARGGLIRGPGSGTSDSILARLSNYEFVNTARAVRFWGPEVFEALNRLQMPKFSLGGLVEGLSRPLVPRQRFAAGGLVTAPAGSGSRGTPVHFHFPGGESFGPMVTDDRIAEGLGRYAQRRKVLSAGRRQSSVGS